MGNLETIIILYVFLAAPSEIEWFDTKANTADGKTSMESSKFHSAPSSGII